MCCKVHEPIIIEAYPPSKQLGIADLLNARGRACQFPLIRGVLFGRLVRRGKAVLPEPRNDRLYDDCLDKAAARSLGHGRQAPRLRASACTTFPGIPHARITKMSEVA